MIDAQELMAQLGKRGITCMGISVDHDGNLLLVHLLPDLTESARARELILGLGGVQSIREPTVGVLMVVINRVFMPRRDDPSQPNDLLCIFSLRPNFWPRP